MNKQEVTKKLTKTKNCMDNETDYKMVDLATILNLLRVEGNQKIFIIDSFFTNNWVNYDYCQLTEEEIKKDYDWAWKYAKEV